MRLILMRHGESKHGVEHFIAGKAGCTGLTAQGVRQAEQLAQRLKNESVACDLLLSTSVKRAHETAAIVGDQLNRQIQINDDLCELLPGDADGLTWAQHQQQYGEFDLQAHPDTPFAPNGESWNQFVDRVQTTLNTLAQTYSDQNVLAVTHAGFIVVSFLLLFEAPFSRQRAGSRNRAEIHPRYASITEWHVSNDTWQLIRFNDTHHL
jgi:broad specificity phosphatase PhoE